MAFPTRLLTLVLCIAAAFVAPSAALAGERAPLRLYAAPGGSGASCTAAAPCTIERAKASVRALLGTTRRDITVNLAGGTYRLAQPLDFGPEDSGAGDQRITWQAGGAVRPVLSGARRIEGWRLVDRARNLWAAPVAASLETRQLYIDGERAPIAQAAPPLGLTMTDDGYTAADDRIAGWRNPRDIEFVFERSNGLWAETRCRIDAVAGTAIAMRQPCWDYSTKRDVGLAYSFAFPSFNANTRPTRIENAFELLQPGQWYLDTQADRLYVMGRPGQRLSRADVEAPVLERIVSGTGTLDRPVRNLTFRGLEFAYATWLDPSGDAGLADVQATVHVGGYDPDDPDPDCDTADPTETCFLVRAPANVQFHAADDIELRDNVFTHLGAAGVGFEYGSHRNVVEGNVLEDISGVGIFLGNSNDPHPEDVGADEREISTHNTVANNVIRNVGAEFHSGSGIVHFYTRHTRIEHNQISDVPWDAIDSGAVTGQVNTSEDPDRATNINSDNTIARNVIYDFKTVLDDGGGIYLTGHQGATIRTPGGEIDREASFAHGTQLEGNVVYNMARHYFALYNDLGSQWITWRRNAQWGAFAGNGGCAPIGHFRFLDNYVANPVGLYFCSPPRPAPVDLQYEDTHTIPDRPGARDVPDDILAGAGLQGRFRALTTSRPPEVRSFEPRVGVAAGPTEVLVTGAGFGPETRVAWDGVRATSVEVLSSNFLRATAPAGAQLAQVTVSTRAGTLTAPAPVDIADAYDLPVISDDWSTQTGELSIGFVNQWSYSAQSLADAGAPRGGTVTHGGVRFRWPDSRSGEPDAVLARGQAIRVSGRGDTLGFLLSGLEDVTGTGTILYADGTRQPYELRAGAWSERTPGAEVALTAHRNDGYAPGCCADEPAYVYYAGVPLRPGKRVAAVILPFTSYPHEPIGAPSNMFVFAVGVS